MKPLAPNTLLQNRYLVVHLIGKGGMGEVYLAVDQRLGSAIALKRTLHGDDAQLGDAFEREARTLARLRHPALPKVSDHFIENDNQYLIMDHISGDDLAKRLSATQKPFPLSWVLFWADQLLDALAYLHSHEPPIIHRDIKPQNLKLTDENNIVLLDFGLSKNSVNITNLTSGGGSTGSVVGYTPHYAPMEQIRGTGTSPRSDIYSLSATLYQLLTNIVPPDALSRADSLLSGKPDPITPISEINGETPRTISDVIIKGMSISQDQRYGDAREMQKILRETYAKMQNATAEKTVAFNSQEDQPVPVVQSAPILPADQAEQFSAPVSDLGAQTIPYGMMENKAKGAETPLPIPPKIEQNQDFDATIRLDSAPQTVSEPTNIGQKTEILPVSEPAPLPQSNVKTEVFNGDFGAGEYLKNNEPAPPNFINEDLSKKEQIPLPPPNFTGDKTVPFIAFEEQRGSVDFAQTQPASAFNALPPVENFTPAAETSLPSGDYSRGIKTYPEPVQPANQPLQKQPVQPPKKKSKGLVFAVLGGLFGLLILAAGALGIGYYFMNQPGNSGLTNVATPTPVPSVTLTPTPEQTPEQVNANININSDVNSNSEIVTNSSPNNSAINTAPSPEKTKPVVTATQTPEIEATVKPVITPRPTQATVNTPRPQTSKPPKPNGKPETKPTLRGTTIPQ